MASVHKNNSEYLIGKDKEGRERAYFEIHSRHFYGWFGGYEDNS